MWKTQRTKLEVQPLGRPGAFCAIFCGPSECSGRLRLRRGHGRPEPGSKARAEGDRASCVGVGGRDAAAGGGHSSVGTARRGRALPQAFPPGPPPSAPGAPRSLHDAALGLSGAVRPRMETQHKAAMKKAVASFCRETKWSQGGGGRFLGRGPRRRCTCWQASRSSSCALIPILVPAFLCLRSDIASRETTCIDLFWGLVELIGFTLRPAGGSAGIYCPLLAASVPFVRRLSGFPGRLD